MNDEIYMLWLSSLYKLGSRKQNQLLNTLHSAQSVFNASEALLRTVPGLTDNNIEMLIANRRIKQTEDLLREMESKQIRFLSQTHPAFPSLLREIPDAPVGIYYWGELPEDEKPRVSIIGARRCSEYGLRVARILSQPLAARQVVIVSGMARGIDSTAHRAAIEGGGETIAVLGCGVDICYPPENRALRENIIKHGCVLSEYPPGVTPIPAYFPARNRIISGLCQVTVVVEAAKKSGTFITVDQALDQGRDVMAVPGNITSPLSEGTNALLKEGAAQAGNYEDILQVLGLESVEPLVEAVNEKVANLAPEEKLVYDSLAFEPVTFDELVLKTNSQAHTIHYICMMLEMKGFIQKLPGQRYIRAV